MKLSIIIPNYNGLRFLPKCLSSLADQTFPDFDILIVDNGSADESVAFIKKNYPEIRLLALPRNIGFSAAVNLGIRSSESPYIMLLNNDTTLAPDCVERLLSCIERKPHIFSAGARILTDSKPHLIDTCGDYYSVMGYAFCRGQGLRPDTALDRSYPVFTNCACAAVYRRSLLQKTGLFDERFFAYLEDVDIGFRARCLGFSNVHCPEAVVLHTGSGTTRTKYTAFKVYHSAMNNILLRRKNLTFFQRLLHFPAWTAGTCFKYLFFRGKRLGSAYAGGCIAGICTAFHTPVPKRTLRGSIVSFIRTEPWIIHGSFLYIGQYIKRRILTRSAAKNHACPM